MWNRSFNFINLDNINLKIMRRQVRNGAGQYGEHKVLRLFEMWIISTVYLGAVIAFNVVTIIHTFVNQSLYFGSSPRTHLKNCSIN